MPWPTSVGRWPSPSRPSSTGALISPSPMSCATPWSPAANRSPTRTSSASPQTTLWPGPCCGNRPRHASESRWPRAVASRTLPGRQCGGGSATPTIPSCRSCTPSPIRGAATSMWAVRVDPLADALFRADAWFERTVVSLYVGNTKFRHDDGPKTAPRRILAGCDPPWHPADLRLRAQDVFGRVHLPRDDDIDAMVARSRPGTGHCLAVGCCCRAFPGLGTPLSAFLLRVRASATTPVPRWPVEVGEGRQAPAPVLDLGGDGASGVERAARSQPVSRCELDRMSRQIQAHGKC
jgi:hypothetical protein